jgi:hypothetical protein
VAVVLALVLARPSEAQRVSDLVHFARGEARLKIDGRAVALPLVEGKLSSVVLQVKGRSVEVLTLSLTFGKGKKGSQDRVQLVLSNLAGPGRYKKGDLARFEIWSRGKRAFVHDEGTDCSFELSRGDARGITASGRCASGLEAIELTADP